MSETWDKITERHIKMPKEMADFLAEIEEVCLKHKLSISHEDRHGSFEIEEYQDDNMRWLKRANKDYIRPFNRE